MLKNSKFQIKFQTNSKKTNSNVQEKRFLILVIGIFYIVWNLELVFWNFTSAVVPNPDSRIRRYWG